MSGQGHNVDAGGKLRSFIERVERVEEEIKGLNGDKSEVYKEAKGEGYDVKVMRKVVAARKMDSVEREEQGALFDMYWNAIHGVSEEAPHVRAHVHVHEEPNPVAKAADDENRVGVDRAEAKADAPDVSEAVSRDEPNGEQELHRPSGVTPAGEPVRHEPVSAEREPAPNYQPQTIKPPPSDEDLEIPEFLKRSDGYARSAQ